MAPPAPASPSPPLAATAEHLNALSPYIRYGAEPPTGEGWYPLARVAEGDLVPGWHQELSRRTGDARVAGAHLSAWLIAAALDVWLMPVVVASRLPLAGPDRAFIHRGPEGWFDAVAVDGREAAVLPGDPAAGAPGTRVLASRDELLDAFAERLLALEPVLRAAAAGCRRTEASAWSELADRLAARSLWLARLAGRDRAETWADAAAVMDRLAAGSGRLRTRPRPFIVRYSGGEEWFAVASVCCLHYRIVPGADPDGTGYCATCPLRTDAGRERELRERLEAEAAGKGAGAS